VRYIKYSVNDVYYTEKIVNISRDILFVIIVKVLILPSKRKILEICNKNEG